MSGISVLFLCIHNSARSQMAEAFLKQLGGERFEAESAGLEPGNLNPLAVAVMKEVGIDISRNPTKGVELFLNSKRIFDYVVTVCDESSAQRCPIFPGSARKLHWSLPDPSSLSGTEEEKLAEARVIRDEIKARISAFIKSIQ